MKIEPKTKEECNKCIHDLIVRLLVNILFICLLITLGVVYKLNFIGYLSGIILFVICSYYIVDQLNALFRVKTEKMILELNGERYRFLHENNFSFVLDNHFEGTYKGFLFKVFPQENKKLFKSDCYKNECIYTAYRTETNTLNFFQFIMQFDVFTKKDIILGRFLIVCETKPYTNTDFEEYFNRIVSLCEQENLKPATKLEWEFNVENYENIRPEFNFDLEAIGTLMRKRFEDV